MSVVHGSFTIERRFAAPVGRVWRALTEVEAKARWFAGPPGWELLERSMDVREGGREVLRGRFANGLVSTFEATYYDVVPGERLVYGYVMHQDARKISVSLATVCLRNEDGGTRFLLTEQGVFLDGYDDAGARETGSGYLLDALGASLKG